MPKKLNLLGEIFGRLTVIQEGAGRKGRPTWICKCECGNIKETTTQNLRSGDTQSCGCLHSEVAKSTMYKHGKIGTKEYRAWYHMKDRCSNPNNESYRYYGGKGITVYEGWKNDFKAFYDHIGPCPNSDLTIDRIDNNKGYEPGNVRWASWKTQANNRAPHNTYK